MDGRDAFLTMARDKHYEFSSLRRAQFSTLSMLYELHNQGQDKFVYTCNNCKNHVETRYHCTICDVRFTKKNSNENFHQNSTFRTSTCAFRARRKSVTNTRWNASASTSTMDPHRPMDVLNQTHKRPASSRYSAASNRWCTRVSAAMPTAACHHVRR